MRPWRAVFWGAAFAAIIMGAGMGASSISAVAMDSSIMTPAARLDFIIRMPNLGLPKESPAIHFGSKPSKESGFAE